MLVKRVKPLDTKKYTQPGALKASLDPIYLFGFPRGNWCAGSALGREAPEIQDTAGTAWEVTERSDDGTRAP